MNMYTLKQTVLEKLVERFSNASPEEIRHMLKLMLEHMDDNFIIGLDFAFDMVPYTPPPATHVEDKEGE